jgi:hypothetical protein
MKEDLLHCILKLAETDQKIRNCKLNELRLLKRLRSYVIYSIDSIHNRRIHKLIKEYGYPSQESIGNQGM